MKVMNGPEAEVRVGNCLPLENIPVGTHIHNIELLPGKGGQLVRSAGLSAQLITFIPSVSPAGARIYDFSPSA